MEDMFDVIAAHTPVGWLELVMNHSSFSQTVENIFTLSFLVRVAHMQQPCALLPLRPIGSYLPQNIHVSLQRDRLCYHGVSLASKMFDFLRGLSQHRRFHPFMHTVLEVCSCSTQRCSEHAIGHARLRCDAGARCQGVFRAEQGAGHVGACA